MSIFLRKITLLFASFIMMPMAFAMQDFSKISALFVACSQDDLPTVQKIVECDPSFFLDFQEWGGSPLLSAARYANVNIIKYLIGKGANKAIKNKGNSVLGYVIYDRDTYSDNDSYEILNLYTPDQITQECKFIAKGDFVIPLEHSTSRGVVETVLKNLKSFGFETCMKLAYEDKNISLIIKLLEYDTEYMLSSWPLYYPKFSQENHKATFILREIGNLDPIPQHILNALYYVSDPIKNNYFLPKDITNYILLIYIKKIKISHIKLAKEEFAWKPVCIAACELAGLRLEDQNACFAQVRSWSREKKMTISKLLLKQGQ
jgi:hypothetical protein